MSFFSLLINQIAIMLILMALGYLLYKVGLISDAGAKDMSNILLYLVIPVVIIKSFILERTSENISNLINATIFSIVAMVISIIISYLFFGKKDGVANFSSAFSNAGFIGIPIVRAVVGEEAVFYISMMIVLINSLQWTYGVYMISDDKSAINPKKIITNPIVVSVIIGLFIFFLEIPVPKIVTSIFVHVANLNTCLAMLVSGVYLAQSNLLKMLKKINVYKVSILRLIIIPLITLMIFRFFPIGRSDIKLAIIIASACPVGSNVAIFANLYNKDYISAIEEVCMSTLLCILTLPLIVSFARCIL